MNRFKKIWVHGLVALIFMAGTSGGVWADDERYVNTQNPKGYLFNKLTGGALAAHGIKLWGWGQVSYMANDHGEDDQHITGSFSHDEGFNLNQVGVQLEKAPKSNVVGRVGPFPGPKPASMDWGFTLTGIYGSDALYFKTAGLDDEWDVDKHDEEKLVFAQAFLDVYLPFLDGTNVMAGVFHTPLLNEIGFPYDPPSPFNTHTMAFHHGPAKHAGVLVQSKLPMDASYGLLSLEFGLVQGWWNLDNQNDDIHLLYAIRWRSGDLRTWIDLEGSYGNGEGESSDEAGSPQGGSPFVAASTTGETLIRTHHNLSLTHVINPKWSLSADATLGTMEAADNSALPPVVGITEDSEWYGFTLAFFYQYRPDMKFGLRGEWFRDDDGAHAWWQAAGPTQIKYDDNMWAVTANLSWTPMPFIRIRPEIRYDWYDGSETPYGKVGSKTSPTGRVIDGGFLPGTQDSQFVGAIDVTIFF